tara:strand:+ start:213 stop:869 length:657 start_codon:yes stop_codon:yes gene_type:complete
MKHKNWTIDEVLDPSSKFWDKILVDIELYINSLEPDELEELGKSPFTDRISDFLDYFKSLSPKNKFKVHKSIEKTENLVVDVLWGMISKKDKSFIFKNSIEYFSDWIDTCPPELLDVYINKLANGDSLSMSTNDIVLDPKIEPSSILDIIKKSVVSEESCNVSIWDGKIIISSMKKQILSKFKDLMISSGNIFKEYRSDRIDSGIMMHSYIFEINKLK